MSPSTPSKRMTRFAISLSSPEKLESRQKNSQVLRFPAECHKALALPQSSGLRSLPQKPSSPRALRTTRVELPHLPLPPSPKFPTHHPLRSKRASPPPWEEI